MPVGPADACASGCRTACAPGRVQLLTAGTDARGRRDDDGVLTVTVPSIDVHEVIAIDTEGTDARG